MSLDVAELTAYCRDKPGAWADNPWEHEHPVIKVGPGERGKIFAFRGATTVGVKVAPTREEADEWLQRYPDDAATMPYIGRSGWNNLTLGGFDPGRRDPGRRRRLLRPDRGQTAQETAPLTLSSRLGLPDELT